MTQKNPHDHWQRAVSFAARVHQGQVRKDRVTPYAAHPFRVAMTVRHVFGVDDPVALCTALLHDAIEDTATDYDDIYQAFGSDVADAVAHLTKDMRLPNSSREPAYDQQLTQASWQTRLVKLADVYDNICDTQNTIKPEKALAKARRALVCAGDDPRLADAVQRVTELVQQVAEARSEDAI